MLVLASSYKMTRHLLRVPDFSAQEINEVLDKATDLKKNPSKYKEALKDKTLLMIFEKPSLRTRVSFETGMTQLGGHAIYYNVQTSPLGKKETIGDTAKTTSRYVDIIMARLLKFEDIKGLAENASVPVIDALSELNHPCQILGDLLTIKEHKGKLKGLTLTYLGDCENNVTYSLLHGCALTGINIKLGCPEDNEFMPKKEIVDEAKKLAEASGSDVEVLHDAEQAAKDADVIYTDSWMSYHISEDNKEERLKKLMPFQVNNKLMKHAKEDAVFMNCLPAMRGMEQDRKSVV